MRLRVELQCSDGTMDWLAERSLLRDDQPQTLDVVIDGDFFQAWGGLAMVGDSMETFARYDAEKGLWAHGSYLSIPNGTGPRGVKVFEASGWYFSDIIVSIDKDAR